MTQTGKTAQVTTDDKNMRASKAAKGAGVAKGARTTRTAKTTKTTKAANTTAKKNRWRGQKAPTLDPASQVAYLAKRGVTFERVDTRAAARYLRDIGGFMGTGAYKSLWPKQTDEQGLTRYVGLDFSCLVDLAEIDHQLRHVFLIITLDVEHAAKLDLLHRANMRHEDPNLLVTEYFDTMSEGKAARLTAELDSRRGTSDIWSGELIDKYAGDMPLWVIAEVLDFGDFLDLWKFCATRWHSRELTLIRYLLKDVKDLRNACAHGSVCLAGIGSGHVAYDVPAPLAHALSYDRIGTPTEQARWLDNPRTLELLAALWAHRNLVRSNDRRKEAASDITSLLDRARRHADWYADIEVLKECYRFFSDVAAVWMRV